MNTCIFRFPSKTCSFMACRCHFLLSSYLMLRASFVASVEVTMVTSTTRVFSINLDLSPPTGRCFSVTFCLDTCTVMTHLQPLQRHLVSVAVMPCHCDIRSSRLSSCDRRWQQNRIHTSVQPSPLWWPIGTIIMVIMMKARTGSGYGLKKAPSILFATCS